MTTAEVKALLISVDPDVQRYDHDHKGSEAYTVWHEISPIGLYGDGREEGSLHFQVDRFTKVEDEEIARQLLETLEEQDDIAVDYHVDYERDTGYIHHIYDCEGI